ncbi:SRPBCC family protein [Candidatus Neomarinimicrobiota bacterium]
MKISNTIEIRSTPEDVFYWLEDPGRAKEWMTSVSETEIIKETPKMVGTTFREIIEENGRKTEMRGVVTEFVSNKRLAFYLEGDFNSTDVCFILEGRDEMTKLTQNAEVHFRGVTRVFSLFLGPFFKKKIMNQARSEFARLKELCEQAT